MAAVELESHVASLVRAAQTKTEAGQPELLQQAFEGRLLLSQGNWDEALPLLRAATDSARSLCTSSAEGKFLWVGFLCDVGADLASTLDYLGDIVGAEGMFNELLCLRPNGVFLGDYAVFLHRRKRDFSQAEAFYVRALQLHPHQSSIHLKYAGFLRHVKKDLRAAEAAYRKAIEADKTNADAIGSYASFLHGVLGQVDAAEELYLQAVKLDGFHANNLCNYGLFLSEERSQFAAAEKLYRQALSHSPRHANTLYNLAVMLDTHLGRKPEAEEQYRRALDVEPRHAYCLYNLAVLLEDKQLAAERAEERAARMQAAAGGAGAAGAAAGVVAEGESRRQEARAEIASLYQRAVDCDPRDATAVADFGRFLLTRMGDVDAAETQLFAALQLDAENAVAIYNMALLLHKHRGSLTGAESLLVRLAGRTPKHAAALQQLARVLLDKFRASADERDLEASFMTFHKAAEALKDPALCLLEYLKVVSEMGSGRQRRRAAGFVEEIMSAAERAGWRLGREGDLRTAIEAVKVLGGEGKASKAL